MIDGSGRESILVRLKPVTPCRYQPLKADKIRHIYGMADEVCREVSFSDAFLEGRKDTLHDQTACRFVYKPYYLDISRDKDDVSVRMQKSIRKSVFLQTSILNAETNNSRIVEGLISGEYLKTGSYLAERSVIPEFGKTGQKVDFSNENPYQEWISQDSIIDFYFGVNGGNNSLSRSIMEKREVCIAGNMFHAKALKQPPSLNLNGAKMGVVMANLYISNPDNISPSMESYFRIGYDNELQRLYFRAGSTFSRKDLEQIMDLACGTIPFVMWI